MVTQRKPKPSKYLTIPTRPVQVDRDRSVAGLLEKMEGEQKDMAKDKEDLQKSVENYKDKISEAEKEIKKNEMNGIIK